MGFELGILEIMRMLFYDFIINFLILNKKYRELKNYLTLCSFPNLQNPQFLNPT